MRTIICSLLTAMLMPAAALLSHPAAAQGALSESDKVALQTTMTRYIDHETVGDAFLHVDPISGEVQKLYPASQHPMLVQLRDVVVLCADLRTADGKTVNADFYATREKSGKFKIFQAEIGNRQPLARLIAEGAAFMLE